MPECGQNKMGIFHSQIPQNLVLDEMEIQECKSLKYLVDIITFM